MLAGNQLLEFLHQPLTYVASLLAIDQYIKPHQLIFTISDQAVFNRGIALGALIHLAKEVCHHLSQPINSWHQLLAMVSTASVNTSWLTGLPMV